MHMIFDPTDGHGDHSVLSRDATDVCGHRIL
jgi:hypothetical protein